MSEDLSLSEELRRAREARGESLDQIHQRTGIALKILQGLENGEFDVVEPVYARLAINHYAVYLGLDCKAFEQRLYDDVDATRPPLVLVQTSPASAIHSLPEPSPLADLIRSQPPARLATIGAILVVGVELHRHGPAPVRQREIREVLRRDLEVAGLAARAGAHARHLRLDAPHLDAARVRRLGFRLPAEVLAADRHAPGHGRLVD